MASLQYEVAVAIPVPVPEQDIDTKHKPMVYSRAGDDLWIAIRQSLLCQVDAIERHLGISPRTSELRKQAH